MAITFYLRESKVDPFVHYHGKTLPTDKAPLKIEAPNLNVPYNGNNLPADKVTYQRPAKDLTNNPSRFLIAGLQLPPDTAVYITGEKILAMTNILDGVSVFERVTRKPYSLEFEMTLRTVDSSGGGYIFPQEDLLTLWTKVWQPDSVQTVENTLMNKLGIQEIIIDRITATTVRGSKNLPIRMTAWENQVGQSLIIG